MLALESPIKARLLELPALTGWAVRAGTELTDRRIMPAVDVRCSGAQTRDSEASAVTLDPVWTITLIVRRSDQAADQLDAALSDVIGSLHNWYPGQINSRPWRRMAVQSVREPEFPPEGSAAYELIFVTSAVYHGQVPNR
jgi:hypothetical protein